MAGKKYLGSGIKANFMQGTCGSNETQCVNMWQKTFTDMDQCADTSWARQQEASAERSELSH